MAIANKIQIWDHVSAPIMGQIIYDHMSMQGKIFDGKSWITICSSALEDLSIDEILNLANGIKNISDEFLEGKYTDLRIMREQQEAAYGELRDKYKVFEILSIKGE